MLHWNWYVIYHISSDMAGDRLLGVCGVESDSDSHQLRPSTDGTRWGEIQPKTDNTKVMLIPNAQFVLQK